MIIGLDNLARQVGRVGVDHQGEDKLPQRLFSGLTLPKGPLQESWRGSYKDKGEWL